MTCHSRPCPQVSGRSERFRSIPRWLQISMDAPPDSAEADAPATLPSGARRIRGTAHAVVVPCHVLSCCAGQPAAGVDAAADSPIVDAGTITTAALPRFSLLALRCCGAYAKALPVGLTFGRRLARRFDRSERRTCRSAGVQAGGGGGGSHSFDAGNCTRYCSQS
jgi:hypothetical protein